MPPDWFFDQPVALMLAAIDEAEDARLEPYRVAAYPVFLERGKEGVSWDRFLAGLNLGYPDRSGGRKSKKMTRAALDELYARAERIKAADLGARNV